MAEQNEQVTQLINNLTEFARIGLGKTQLHPELISIRHVIETAIDEVSLAISDSSQKLLQQ